MYKQYEAFENAEEVWLWCCACLEARREGLRPAGIIRGRSDPAKSATLKG